MSTVIRAFYTQILFIFGVSDMFVFLSCSFLSAVLRLEVLRQRLL